MSRGKRRRVVTITGVLVLACSVAWFLAVERSIIGFSVAAAVAIAWCIWLGRRPET